uniref:Lon N-terminal domain-containing protein n=1 Tax=Odontella aurita TaxID=265563 RepID=A0A7S4HR69_9STRA|mmetsp:Transcript_13814/g.40388  ORF Transcript_13814/g.40388 Transcript_13814/m.40388 type:complete len:459 (+) Transcript_13814:756-2132(+)
MKMLICSLAKSRLQKCGALICHVPFLRFQTTIEAMEKLSSDGTGYVGVFLRKDSSSGVSESGLVLETPELITDPSELFGVGTFAQIHRIHRGVGFGTGASGLHAHPTKQEWDKLSLNNDGSDDSAEQTIGEEGESDGPPSSASVLLYTHRRIDLQSVENVGPPIDLKVSHWDRLQYNPKGESKVDDTIRALTNEVLSTIRDVAQMNPLFREHLQYFPNRIDPSDPYRLADFVATVTTGSPEELQAVLEEKDAELRLHKALVLISKEREVSKLQQEISAKVEEKMSDAQRKYFLNEQLKSIKKELGMEQDDKEALIDKYRKKLKDYPQIPEEAMGVIDSELEKLSTLEKNSTEFNVTRSYLDWLTAIPWGNMSDETFDIREARTILDRDHYGLDDLKDIILQFIAVGKLKGTVQGKILCLAGPPGVGKVCFGIFSWQQSVRIYAFFLLISCSPPSPFYL